MINLKLKKKDYEWVIGFLLGKILYLYWKFDQGNFELNSKNLEDELHAELRNHKND